MGKIEKNLPAILPCGGERDPRECLCVKPKSVGNDRMMAADSLSTASRSVAMRSMSSRSGSWLCNVTL